VCAISSLTSTFAISSPDEFLLSICHGGSRPQRCAGGGICGVINNFGGNRNLVITVAIPSTSTMLVCTIIESTATMYYNCIYKTMQVAESNVPVSECAHQADTRSVCVILQLTGQHFIY